MYGGLLARQYNILNHLSRWIFFLLQYTPDVYPDGPIGTLDGIKNEFHVDYRPHGMELWNKGDPD